MRNFYLYSILYFLFTFFLPLIAQAQIVDPGFVAQVRGNGSSMNLNATALQKDGKIIIAAQRPLDFADGNPYGRNIARLNANGSIDKNFDSGVGTNELIRTIAIQSDGKIVIGGSFTAYNQKPINYIARLNIDGSLDSTFKVGSGFNDLIYSIKVLPDDKILVAGRFTLYNKIAQNRILRLHRDGAIDQEFNPGTGPNIGEIYDMELFNDQIIILGGFTSFNGNPHNRIARLHENGSVDNTFNVGTATTQIIGISVNSSGKILVYGYFSSFNGMQSNSLIILKTDGTIDTSFKSSTIDYTAVDHAVFDSFDNVIASGRILTNSLKTGTLLARFKNDGTFDEAFNTNIGKGALVGLYGTILVQADNKLILASDFNSFNGSSHRHSITRLLADGTVDTSFSHSLEPAGKVFKIVIQPDGKILVGGMFNGINEVQTLNIYRLLSDGSKDVTFKTVTMQNVTSGTTSSRKQDYINDIKIQKDGKILLAGSFTSINGIAYRHLARLNSDGSIDNSFNIGSGASSTNIRNIEILTSGQILVCGIFGSFDGVARNNLARLYSDGSLDHSFDVQLHTLLSENSPLKISRIWVDKNEKILVTFGRITNDYQDGVDIVGDRILRLNSDGSLDKSFALGSTDYTNSEPVSPIRAVGIQSDGKIIIGGHFFTFNNKPSQPLIRLHPNGTLDSTFQVNFPSNKRITAMQLRHDSLWIASYLALSKSIAERQLTIDQLDANGHLIKSAPLSKQNPLVSKQYGVEIHSLLLQADNKLIIGGNFREINGQPRIGLARLIYLQAPSRFMVQIASPKKVNLTWQDNSGAESGFEIQRSLSADKDFSILATTGPDHNSYSDTTVSPGVTYYYCIRAIHPEDSSGFSQKVSVAMPKLLQTITFEPIPDKTLEEGTLNLTATSSSSLPVQFQVISGPAKEEGNQIVFEMAGRVTVKAFQEGNTTYEAAPAIERNFCINPPKPAITTQIDSINATLILSSSSSAGNQWFWNGTIIEGAALPSYQVTKAGSYSVQVTASGGCSTISEEVILTGTGEELATFQWHISPNPTNGFLQVSYIPQTSTKEVKVYMYNMLGSKVADYSLMKKGDKWHADVWLNNIPKGRYIVVLQDNNKRVIKTLIKQ